ncbi:MAG: 5-formyltetrahydrofolate cyclo-ligase [Kangiellaceae bacterium]|nr:5-formyltetrahydrofolate cyclo-ligase [Kangiellaceae bacterium]
MANIQQQKSALRQSIRQHRNAISQSAFINAEQAVVEQLNQFRLFEKHLKFGCFLSFDGEISTKKVIQEIQDNQLNCYLPKLKPFKPNRLWFMPFQQDSTMISNRFGIPEVDLAVNHALPVSKLDVVLMPLVGFDLAGNRLGMGGGFYDTTFAHLRNNKNRPLFIGLAYELQKFATLPSDSWDLPLDGVCTEKAFYSFAN